MFFRYFSIKLLLEVLLNEKNNSNNDKIWFKNLQKVREAKGYTQVKLAMIIEISQQSITYYETGTRVPSLEIAYKLASALNTTIDYLIGNNDNIINQYYSLSNKDKEAVHMIIEGLSNKGNSTD